MSKSERRARRRSPGEAAARRAAMHKSETGGTSVKVPEGYEFFSNKEGAPIKIDILPYVVGDGNPWAEKGDLYYERTYYVHKNVGPNSKTYVCPAKTAGKRCPICEWLTKASRDPAADEQLIKDLLPKERQLFWVVDRKDPERAPKLWDQSFHLFGRLLDARLSSAEEEDNWQDFANLKGGFSLKVTFEEKKIGRGTPFYIAQTIDFKNRADDYDESLADELPCLDDLLIVPEYDKLKKIFLQEEDASDIDEEDESEEAPAKPKRKAAPVEDDSDDDEEEEAPPPKRKRRPKPVEEDEEEEAPAPPKKVKVSHKEDADDDEEEAPAKSKRRPKPAPVEDDDEDLLDEEEEAPPPKKKKAAPVEEEDEEEAPAKPAKKAGGKNKCPAGGTFGEDCDTLDACPKCDLWNDCDDAKYSG